MEGRNDAKLDVKVTNAFKCYGYKDVINGLDMNVSSGSM